jgi:hypothetical protein
VKGVSIVEPEPRQDAALPEEPPASSVWLDPDESPPDDATPEQIEGWIADQWFAIRWAEAQLARQAAAEAALRK